MAVVAMANTSKVDDVVKIMTRDGGVIIENFLSNEILNTLRSDLFPILNHTPHAAEDEFLGKKTRRLSRLFERSRTMADVATHPLYYDVARTVLCKPVHVWLGPDRTEMIPEMRIGMAQAIQIWPGETPQPLHRDDNVFLWRHPTNGREARVQIMIAMTDFTAQNGGTLVIPGSHLWDDERVPQIDEAVPTEMKAGAALMFLGSTYHAGGANQSDAPRTGLTMALDAAHLRQEENMYLTLSPETVASYPEPMQRLLGWSAGRNFMGWIEADGQLRDPIELVSNGKVLSLAGELEAS
jgi:ectoine hydroxylase-related dioxygenase (phytanoyl-CoA dioxygenase family)